MRVSPQRLCSCMVAAGYVSVLLIMSVNGTYASVSTHAGHGVMCARVSERMYVCVCVSLVFRMHR